MPIVWTTVAQLWEPASPRPPTHTYSDNKHIINSSRGKKSEYTHRGDAGTRLYPAGNQAGTLSFSVANTKGRHGRLTHPPVTVFNYTHRGKALCYGWLLFTTFEMLCTGANVWEVNSSEHTKPLRTPPLTASISTPEESMQHVDLPNTGRGEAMQRCDDLLSSSHCFCRCGESLVSDGGLSPASQTTFPASGEEAPCRRQRSHRRQVTLAGCCSVCGHSHRRTLLLQRRPPSLPCSVFATC